MKPKERFLAALWGKETDRISVFCANQTATYEQMERLGVYWPEANYRAEPMARLAVGAFSILGFDAVRVPFCQTIEAEALGCTLKEGGREGLPSVAVHPYKIGDPVTFPEDFLSRNRVPELIKAVKLLKEMVGDEVAVIGGIIGPFSIAASLVGVTELLMASFKKPDSIQPYLEAGERAGALLANALLEAGADVICIEDMMASLDMISPAIYRSVVAPWETKLISEIKGPTIIHICGKLDAVIKDVAMTGITALSVEPKVNAARAKEVLSEFDRYIPLIGGVDAVHTLFNGEPADVKKEVEGAIAAGYSMIAPGCSIPPATPLDNLLAMVEAAVAG